MYPIGFPPCFSLVKSLLWRYDPSLASIWGSLAHRNSKGPALNQAVTRATRLNSSSQSPSEFPSKSDKNESNPIPIDPHSKFVSISWNFHSKHPWNTKRSLVEHVQSSLDYSKHFWVPKNETGDGAAKGLGRSPAGGKNREHRWVNRWFQTPEPVHALKKQVS